MKVFLPSWSPGSYLMREYARHIRWFEASQINGEVLFHEQVEKGVWEINWDKSNVNTTTEDAQISYEIYCKELTVRTSHVDHSHAFLHGPSYLMGIEGEVLNSPTIEFRFPPLWSKISTALKDISTERMIN
jgi:predicted metalloprotease with PDZ domain